MTYENKIWATTLFTKITKAFSFNTDANSDLSSAWIGISFLRFSALFHQLA